MSPPLDMAANVADLPRSIRPARLPAGGGRHPRISSAFAEAKVIHVFRPNLPVRQLPFVRQRRERLPAPAGTNDWVATAGGTPTFRRDAPFPGRRFPPPLPRGHACAEPAPAEARGNDQSRRDARGPEGHAVPRNGSCKYGRVVQRSAARPRARERSPGVQPPGVQPRSRGLTSDGTSGPVPLPSVAIVFARTRPDFPAAGGRVEGAVPATRSGYAMTTDTGARGRSR